MADRPRNPVLLHSLPVMAALAWVAAVLWSGVRLNPWGPFGGDLAFYGVDAPGWLPFLFLGLGLAGLVGAMLLRHLALPYAAVAPVAVLGGGAKQLGSTGTLLDLLVFGLLLLATIEFLTVRGRFQGVVDSARNLEKGEQPPLVTFLARYLVGLVLACAVLGGLLFLFIDVVAPRLASLFSARIADGVELESAVGITLFVAIPILAAVSIRVLVDGVRARRAPVTTTQSDIQDLRPIAREGPQ